MSDARRKWVLLGAATGVVAVLGFVGDWFGRTDMGDVYPSDAVSYLDCARAFGRGDLTAALNPLWNQGYPALVALVRPIFPAGPEGVWSATHWLNLAILMLGWFCFAWLVRELVLLRRGETEEGAGPVVGFGALCLFLTAQLCIDQVSRVGPDKLVAVFFFLTSAMIVRMVQRPGWGLAAGLGLTMGLGFLAKSAFLPLGLVVVLVLAWTLWRRGLGVKFVVPVVLLFGLIVAGYGTALSRANGWVTLGESGPLNYAWHVNRLAKWVHWEGGTAPAAEAWPSARIARFTKWDTDPPAFGMPLHPTRPVVVDGATIFEFKGTRQATYDPYYDPPYYYQGYKHLVRWRYQVIALGKNVGHLLAALIVQPLFLALALVALMTLWRRPARAEFGGWMQAAGPLAVCAAAGALIYVPVHLEERYISAFLAVLALILLIGVGDLVRDGRVALGILGLGFVLGLVKDQRGGWADLLHGRTHRDNVKWQIGMAVREAGLARGAEVGMISWGANLDTDWANIGEIQVIGEIQSGPDEAKFVALPQAERAEVLGEFRRAGAAAVITRDKVVGTLPGWQQLGAAPVWMYRL